MILNEDGFGKIKVRTQSTSFYRYVILLNYRTQTIKGGLLNKLVIQHFNYIVRIHNGKV